MPEIFSIKQISGGFMTVLKAFSGQIKIILTDDEVLSLFGTYERLCSMTQEIKSTLNSVIKEIIKENLPHFGNKRLKAKLSAVIDCGCTVILTAAEPQNTLNVFLFEGGDILLRAINCLQRQSDITEDKSSLYFFENKYALIIESPKDHAEFLVLKEFALPLKEDSLSGEVIKEYGRPLAIDNAIEIYSRATIKDF